MPLLILFISCLSLAEASQVRLLSKKELKEFAQFSQMTEEEQRSFSRHFRDQSHDVFIHPEDLAKLPPLKDEVRVVGKVKYFGAFNRTYRYTASMRGNHMIIKIKIHFKNYPKGGFTTIHDNLYFAQRHWNEGKRTMPLSFPYSFAFENSHEDEADFSIKFVKDTRGPYDVKWDEDWSSKTWAHEIGHMLGLADEYNEYNRKSFCYQDSIMCRPQNFALHYHYYFILNRIFLQTL